VYTGTTVLADPPMSVVEDTVTRKPAEPGPAPTTLFVVRPVCPPACVWYTHVFPTATGNGIELAFANDSAAIALCRVVSGAVLDSREVAAAAAVPPAFSPGTSGLVPFGTPPHPARAAVAAMAAPARTTLADPCLLM
jgi:hypothetical protein